MSEFKVGDEVTCIRVYDSEGMLTLGDWIVRKVHPWGESIEVQGIDGIGCWSSNQFQHKIKDINDMITFNLERALAGDKVVTRYGGEVNQFSVVNTDKGPTLTGYIVGVAIEAWDIEGSYYGVLNECHDDLFMAPRALTGFVNVYADVTFNTTHDSLGDANIQHRSFSSKLRIACIDLSQFNEGEGL